MFQSWQRLLFMHWRVDSGLLRHLVPPPLEVEEFEGSAWIGATSFELRGLRPRGIPPLPFVSNFPELNLRTYVRFKGKPGVYFFSLDAGSLLAVWGARLSFRLPYHWSRMAVRREEDWIHYASARRGAPAELSLRYRPMGPVRHAEKGQLEYFLTERYALYNVLRGRVVLRAEIHHEPWPLQPAEAEISRNTLLGAHGITVSQNQPLLHYAERQDTILWAPVPSLRRVR